MLYCHLPLCGLLAPVSGHDGACLTHRAETYRAHSALAWLKLFTEESSASTWSSSFGFHLNRSLIDWFIVYLTADRDKETLVHWTRTQTGTSPHLDTCRFHCTYTH